MYEASAAVLVTPASTHATGGKVVAEALAPATDSLVSIWMPLAPSNAGRQGGYDVIS
jgi:hypothetical protein